MFEMSGSYEITQSESNESSVANQVTIPAPY